ncbi:hypothetical protein HK097_006776 [Rhizophlyctis rosea]|uniref:enoyl-[acyl-carrier-protein] reductase n=1 Tax=Rhizophlyctis rosea TaxID=64517 RepID=A0AAD5X4P4_9FUNG|nr:hypothetical protein HK097_006776 [Rhizophlyctis rosea]
MLAIPRHLSAAPTRPFCWFQFPSQVRKFFSPPTHADAMVFEQYGPPDKVMKLKRIPLPPLSNHTVQIKFLAAPINPADLNQIQGTYPSKPTFHPDVGAIGGNEGVAEVVAVGERVKNLTVGDWVIPTKTAIGDTVIQNGANSGVGQAVIQLAKAWGIKSINIIRDRPDIEDLTAKLKSFGADLILTEDQVRKFGTAEKIKQLGGLPKLGLNCVGGKSATNLVRLLGHSGHLVTYGGMSKEPLTLPTAPFIFQNLTCSGYWMTRWYGENSPEKRVEMLEEIFGLIREGKFKEPWCEKVDFRNGEEAVKGSVEGGKRVLVMT